MSAITTCRACGALDLQPILSLGSTPLANALLSLDDLDKPEARYPLDLVFCGDCTLVQITENVAPEILFRNYAYFSSFADTVSEQAANTASRMVSARHLSKSSLVIEAASNDGYLLRHYVAAGVPVLGIEPAENVALVAREQRGIPTVSDFFSHRLALDLRQRGTCADVFHAHNVLAHVPDLADFVRGIATILSKHGVAVIEVPYVRDMIDRCEFDTIYHEHLCYFSVTALHRLLARHELVLADVERIAIHGGSLRLFVGPAGTAATARVESMLAEEEACGLTSIGFYRTFSDRVIALQGSLKQALETLKRGGARISAYGAAAKGATLLNTCGIGRDILDFVVDRNPHKHGHFMPGVHLPIHPLEKILQELPDYLLLLSWNFADEILAQQAEFRRRGKSFILPVPEVKIV